MASTLVKVQRRQEALAAAENAASIAPTDAKTWQDLAALFCNAGGYQQALDAAEKVLLLDPTMSSAWSWKGAALRGLGRKEEARFAFDEWILTSTKYQTLGQWATVGDWAAKTGALLRRGRTQEARDSAERGISCEAETYRDWCDRSTLLLMLERYKDAINAAERAAPMAKKAHTEILKKPGGMYSSEEFSAISACAEALKNKAEALNKLGRFKDALSAAEESISWAAGLYPDIRIDALDNKAEALRGLKRLKEAEDAEAQAKAEHSG